MVQLKNYNTEIINFINEKTNDFGKEYGKISSIGIYSCPWSGWISLNFNTNISLEATSFNCPDFEYVEYDLLDLDDWSDEYNNEIPEFIDLNNILIKLNREEGDEALNKIIFEYLFELIKSTDLKERVPQILLQMLDSKHTEEIK
jgi:hypothetical protein